jgi:hypothetical protein
MHDDLVQQILEKWYECANRRYRILLITLAHKNSHVEPALDTVAEILQGTRLDFLQLYKGNLGRFFTWQQVRDQIYSNAKEFPAIVSGLEPFYSKWPIDERLLFLKNLLRLEPSGGILLLLFCAENLTKIRAIPENSRGSIWAL